MLKLMLVDTGLRWLMRLSMRARAGWAWYADEVAAWQKQRETATALR
jgi:hypothetical protein